MASSFSIVYSILLYHLSPWLWLRGFTDASTSCVWPLFRMSARMGLFPLLRKCRDINATTCSNPCSAFVNLPRQICMQTGTLPIQLQICYQRTSFGKSNRLEGGSGEKGWKAACLPPSYRMMRVTIEQRLDFEPLLQCNSATSLMSAQHLWACFSGVPFMTVHRGYLRIKSVCSQYGGLAELMRLGRSS